MSAKKKGLPSWFPFAIASTAVIALLSGSRSGWTLGKDQPKTPPTPPPPPQGRLSGFYWP